MMAEALAKKLDLGWMTLIGLTVFSVGCFIFSNLNLDIAFGNVVIPNIIIGFGMCLIIVPPTTLIESIEKGCIIKNDNS